MSNAYGTLTQNREIASSPKHPKKRPSAGAFSAYAMAPAIYLRRKTNANWLSPTVSLCSNSLPV